MPSPLGLAQHLGQREAQRRASRPARRLWLSSASRACRPTVGPALPRTLDRTNQPLLSALLFESTSFTVRELLAEEIPLLQALFEANPDYFVIVGGQPPRPDEAQQEFDEQVPGHLSFGKRWFAGAFDRAGTLRGLVILVSDLSAPGVWHTALFFLEGSLRRTGAAMELHDALQSYARRSGARWLRLAVIDGNAPAQRFWAKCGYQQVRTRPYPTLSGETKLARVLVKPLADGTLEQYVLLVPRDAPESSLP